MLPTTHGALYWLTVLPLIARAAMPSWPIQAPGIVLHADSPSSGPTTRAEEQMSNHTLSGEYNASAWERNDDVSDLRNIMGLKSSRSACLALLDKHENDLVVIPEQMLIWCPTAKAGTTSMINVISSLIDPNATTPDWVEERGMNPQGYTEFRSTLSMSPTQLVHSFAAQRIRERLQKSDQGRVVMATELNATARHELCASGRALTFTTVRNPWERLVSGYLGKIADGHGDIRLGMIADEIREYYGMDSDKPISFSKFVRFVAQQPDDAINIHFMPQSVRCGAGGSDLFESHRVGWYTIESRIETSFKDDVKRMLRALERSEDLFIEEHISSTVACLESKACTANLEAQIGPKAKWEGDSTGDIARKLYVADSEHDLVEMVRQRYMDDTKLLGYTYHSRFS